MIHGFTEQDWNDYIEGGGDEALRDRIEAHLIGCLSCWERHNQLAHATEALYLMGENVRQNMALQDASLHAGLRGVFEKLSAVKLATPYQAATSYRAIQQRLDALAEVMTPMCGSQTAVRALHAAAVGSPARTLESVTVDNWTPFLKNLRSIATVMCGDTGAHLVWESGQF